VVPVPFLSLKKIPAVSTLLLTIKSTAIIVKYDFWETSFAVQCICFYDFGGNFSGTVYSFFRQYKVAMRYCWG
jgi:hypothetical protein